MPKIISLQYITGLEIDNRIGALVTYCDVANNDVGIGIILSICPTTQTAALDIGDTDRIPIGATFSENFTMSGNNAIICVDRINASTDTNGGFGYNWRCRINMNPGINVEGYGVTRRDAEGSAIRSFRQEEDIRTLTPHPYVFPQARDINDIQYRDVTRGPDMSYQYWNPEIQRGQNTPFTYAGQQQNLGLQSGAGLAAQQGAWQQAAAEQVQQSNLFDASRIGSGGQNVTSVGTDDRIWGTPVAIDWGDTGGSMATSLGHWQRNPFLVAEKELSPYQLWEASCNIGPKAEPPFVMGATPFKTKKMLKKKKKISDVSSDLSGWFSSSITRR